MRFNDGASTTFHPLVSIAGHISPCHRPARRFAGKKMKAQRPRHLPGAVESQRQARATDRPGRTGWLDRDEQENAATHGRESGEAAGTNCVAAARPPGLGLRLAQRAAPLTTRSSDRRRHLPGSPGRRRRGRKKTDEC